MIKTPRGENARLISNVHLEHDTRKIHKKFIRFSLDILAYSTYCKGGDHFSHSCVHCHKCTWEYYS